MGYLSLSHCCDAVLVAWSPDAVGVDLEGRDRCFPAAALADRFYCAEDRRELDGLAGETLRMAVLKQWVAKEALIKMQRGSLALDLSRWRCGADACQGLHPDLEHPVPVPAPAAEGLAHGCCGRRRTGCSDLPSLKSLLFWLL